MKIYLTFVPNMINLNEWNLALGLIAVVVALLLAKLVKWWLVRHFG